MLYKKRYVPVFRDFPKGCGVPSGHISNAKFKRGIVLVHRDFPDFSKIKDQSWNHSEAETSRIEGLDGSTEDESVLESNGGVKGYQEKEVIDKTILVNKRRLSFGNSTTDESIFESNGCVEDHQEKEVVVESADKTRPVKKRRWSLDNSTTEVETGVVSTSKRVIVSALPAKSKCPWRNPKNRGSRQDKRRWML